MCESYKETAVWALVGRKKGWEWETISITCDRTISSINIVVSADGSPVSPETNIICCISTRYLALSDMFVRFLFPFLFSISF